MTSEQLHQRLVENIPELNLNESSQDESEDSGAEVVPLDFRTALLKNENKIVIQAKPMEFKTPEQDLKELLEEENKLKRMGGKRGQTVDDYLEIVCKKPFEEEDGEIILIEPGVKIDEVFGGIDLPCNTEHRLNNTYMLNNTPLGPISAQANRYAGLSALNNSKGPILKESAPVVQKQYDTDSDTEAKVPAKKAPAQKEIPQESNFWNNFKKAADKKKEEPKADKPNINFDSILESMGVDGLDFIEKEKAAQLESEKPEKEE